MGIGYCTKKPGIGVKAKVRAMSHGGQAYILCRRPVPFSAHLRVAFLVANQTAELDPI